MLAKEKISDPKILAPDDVSLGTNEPSINAHFHLQDHFVDETPTESRRHWSRIIGHLGRYLTPLEGAQSSADNIGEKSRSGTLLPRSPPRSMY